MTPEQEAILRTATNRYLQAKSTADLMAQHCRELQAMAELVEARDEPTDDGTPEDDTDDTTESEP